MSKLLKRLFGGGQPASRSGSRGSARSGPARSAPARQIPLPSLPPRSYVVGDIHGMLDLYRDLEAQIVADAAGAPALIVCLGDLIDRGPDSAGVIAHLRAPAPKGIERLVIMGNHEEMFLRFLEAPRSNMRWLGFGGTETLLSYGLTPHPEFGFELPEAHLRPLLDALPQDDITWLRSLPAAVRLGQRHFLCHAGIDPRVPLSAQVTRDLLWSRGSDTAPPDGVTVIHGHVPVETVDLAGPYIGVDTGAYATGRLSALRLMPDAAPALLEATMPRPVPQNAPQNTPPNASGDAPDP